MQRETVIELQHTSFVLSFCFNTAVVYSIFMCEEESIFILDSQ
jgi:hypothetical protein